MSATVTTTLPPLGSAIAETSSSTATITTVLPPITAHLSSGVSTQPPDMTGTAVMRDLTGTATTA